MDSIRGWCAANLILTVVKGHLGVDQFPSPRAQKISGRCNLHPQFWAPKWSVAHFWVWGLKGQLPFFEFWVLVHPKVLGPFLSFRVGVAVVFGFHPCVGDLLPRCGVSAMAPLLPVRWGWAMAPWLPLGCEWAMAPLLPLGWGWAIASWLPLRWGWAMAPWLPLGWGWAMASPMLGMGYGFP